MSHEKTLKLVTNLDRAAIEQRIAAVRNAAKAASLAEVAGLLEGIEGKPRAHFETQVRSALKLLGTQAGQQGLSAQLELVELNLPNLK